jgi:hypothetical protein
MLGAGRLRERQPSDAGDITVGRDGFNLSTSTRQRVGGRVIASGMRRCIGD